MSFELVHNVILYFQWFNIYSLSVRDPGFEKTSKTYTVESRFLNL